MTYTNEQIEEAAKTYEGYGEPVVPAMLRALLTERQAARDVVRDAEDARRYRFIRDTPWFGIGSPLERVIAQQRNAHWDEAIDAAMAAREGGE